MEMPFGLIESGGEWRTPEEQEEHDKFVLSLQAQDPEDEDNEDDEDDTDLDASPTPTQSVIAPNQDQDQDQQPTPTATPTPTTGVDEVNQMKGKQLQELCASVGVSTWGTLVQCRERYWRKVSAPSTLPNNPPSSSTSRGKKVTNSEDVRLILVIADKKCVVGVRRFLDGVPQNRGALDQGVCATDPWADAKPGVEGGAAGHPAGMFVSTFHDPLNIYPPLSTMDFSGERFPALRLLADSGALELNAFTPR